MIAALVLATACSRKTAPVASIDATRPPVAVSIASRVVNDAAWTLRLDVKKMRETHALTVWQAALEGPPLELFMPRMVGLCGFGIDGVDELVASGRGGWWAFAARPAVTPERALACVRALNNAEDTTFEGRPAIQWYYGEQLALVVDGVLYHGERGLLRELLAPRDGGGAVTVGDDDVVSFRGTTENLLRSLDVTLVAGPEVFGLHGRVTTSDPEMAEVMFKNVTAKAMETSGVRQRLVLDGVTLDRAAASVIYKIIVNKDFADASWVVSALGRFTASQVLRLDKTAEARSTIGRILTRMLSAAETAKKEGRVVRLPPSSGPLPKSIPKAQMVPITAAPPSWNAFPETVQPAVFYQYEVITRADGLAATVFARGDLDGNGVIAVFLRTISLDATGTPTVSPLRMINPLE